MSSSINGETSPQASRNNSGDDRRIEDTDEEGEDTDSEDSDEEDTEEEDEELSSAGTVRDLFSALNCADDESVNADPYTPASGVENGGGVDEDYLKQLMSTLHISSAAAADCEDQNQHHSLPPQVTTMRSMSEEERKQRRLTNSVA